MLNALPCWKHAYGIIRCWIKTSYFQETYCNVVWAWLRCFLCGRRVNEATLIPVIIGLRSFVWTQWGGPVSEHRSHTATLILSMQGSVGRHLALVVSKLGLHRTPEGLETELRQKNDQTLGYSGFGRQGRTFLICYSPEGHKLLLNSRNNSGLLAI